LVPPKTKTVAVLAEALEDLREVAVYSRLRWGDQGRDYVRGLRSAVRDLWSYERLWRSVPEHATYRRFRYEKHQIYFTLHAHRKGSEIVVRHVLHARMDPDQHL
jgi:plasmid stabilization system protein ParE